MLRVERLTKRYGALTAIQDVSFDVGPGELDEPFSGLDVSAARVLNGFVRALAEDRKIIVFSSHVLEVP
jgi:ABC-type Na+ transport system ATPase subunit NatA